MKTICHNCKAEIDLEVPKQDLRPDIRGTFLCRSCAASDPKYEVRQAMNETIKRSGGTWDEPFPRHCECGSYVSVTEYKGGYICVECAVKLLAERESNGETA